MHASGNFHSCSSEAPGSGKLLVPKLWGVGYLRFNANKHDKKGIKLTLKEIQQTQAKRINEN
jgi:hypothetical protein